MATFVHTVEIARPPDEVFALITDVTREPEWQPTIREIRRITPGPVGVGTRVAEIRAFAGRTVAVTWQVTVFEPPWRSVIASASGPVTFTAAYELVALPAGTSLTFRLDARVGRLCAPPLLGRGAVREFAGNCERLRDLLEGEAVPAEAGSGRR